MENNSYQQRRRCSKVNDHNSLLPQADNNNQNEDRNLTALENLKIPDATEYLYRAIKRENTQCISTCLNEGASIDEKLNELGHTALHVAAIVSNKSIVTDLIDHGADVNVKDVNGASVLHTALDYETEDLYKHMEYLGSGEDVQRKKIEILTIFLDLGLDVDGKDSRDRTALTIALEKRMPKVVGFLIDRGADVNHRDEANNNLIHLSTIFAHKSPNHVFSYARIIALLISKGVDVDCKNNQGSTPLHLSLKYGLNGITFVLLEHINDIVNFASSFTTVLYLFVDILCKNDRVGCELTKHIDVYKSIERVIEKGASVDVADGWRCSPLRLAVRYCNDEKLITFLSRYSKKIDDFDRDGNTLLHVLIENYVTRKDNRSVCLEAMTSLVRNGANVNKRNKAGLSAMHISVSRNLVEVFEILRGKADFDLRTGKGNNALHLACKNRETDERIIDVLLVQGCDLNCWNEQGLRPLHLAAQSGNLRMVNVLLDQGVDVNCRDKRYNRRPLHVAAEANDPEIIEVLLKRGADVDARELSGKTALLKVDCKKVELVRMFLEYGADFNAKDNERRDLLYYALEQGKQDSLKVLYDLGANINNLKFVNSYPKDIMKLWFGKVAVGCQFYKQILKLDMACLPVATIYKYYTGVTGLVVFCNDVQYKKNYHDLRKTLEYAKREQEGKLMREIKAMKNHSLGALTIYDFLHTTPRRQAIHLGNKALSELVKVSSNIEKIFPEYCGVIRATYNEALKRRRLWQPAYEAFLRLCNCNIPDLCAEIIFDHLSNDDLDCIMIASN